LDIRTCRKGQGSGLALSRKPKLRGSFGKARFSFGWIPIKSDVTDGSPAKTDETATEKIAFYYVESFYALNRRFLNA